jgi:hypothetical protein
MFVFSSYSRIKRILDQSTSQGDERGLPRIGAIGGTKPRDSAQRFTRHGAEEKGPRPTVAVYRRQYPHLFKRHYFTFV